MAKGEIACGSNFEPQKGPTPKECAHARRRRGSEEPSPLAPACGTSRAARTRRLLPRSRHTERPWCGSETSGCGRGSSRGSTRAAQRTVGGCPLAIRQ
eukprot:7098631-Prymnesium_polylepis.2